MSELSTNCVFCKIVAKKVPANVVYEDNKIIAFLDIRPINPGHTLVIPKNHAASLKDLDSKLGGRLFQVAGQIAAAIRKSGLRCEGINVWLADGKAAFQEVPHIHIHVIPRFKGDGLRIQVGPDYGTTPPDDKLQQQAEKIRQALKSL
ncbi:MAG: HIT family protein [Candidatus Thorarchaeota archaeon]